jgi:hypothetical protein
LEDKYLQRLGARLQDEGIQQAAKVLVSQSAAALPLNSEPFQLLAEFSL